jgi:C4-dicarboxylate transporter/malic acid transport protein
MSSKFSNIVKHFSPAWFASVMGTGGLANILCLIGSDLPLLRSLAASLFWLNLALFIILIGPWITRWIMHFGSLAGDLKHPLLSNFFVTMPIGGIILGTNFLTIGRDYFSLSFITSLGLTLWVLGAAMILALGVFVIFNLFSMEAVPAEATNFSWFMPPVASIVIPLLGNILVGLYATVNFDLARAINLIDILFYGTGMLLFVIISSILFNRFIVNKMPAVSALPTFWILLGPIGVGTLSLMGIADSSRLLGWLTSVDTAKILALFLWGFGLWAFLLVAAISIKYIRRDKVPFTLSWWAFIFPLAAYVLSGFGVYAYIKMELVLWYSRILTALLVYLWAITFIRSLLGVFSGKLLVPITPTKPETPGSPKLITK